MPGPSSVSLFTANTARQEPRLPPRMTESDYCISLTPRCFATVPMSLSPRPLMLMRTFLSAGKVLASYPGK